MESLPPELEQSRDRPLQSFLTHQVTASVGVPAGTAVVTKLVLLALNKAIPDMSPVTPAQVLTETHVFPIQIMAGTIVGFLGYYFLKSRAALWTWLLPLCVFITVFT